MSSKYEFVILDDDLFYGNLIKYFLQNQGYTNVSFFEDESTCLKYVSTKPTLYIVEKSNRLLHLFIKSRFNWCCNKSDEIRSYRLSSKR